MRVGLYARVSTTDQHCEQQLHELREYAKVRGWKVEGEYVDQGVSGTKDSRPAMNRLMKAARQRAVDAIVCWKLDRWGRSMPHLVQSVQELKSLGVRFVAVSQGIDTDESNPMAKLLLHLLGAFADFEHDLIVERTRMGLQKARREGRIGGRPRTIVNRVKIAEMDAEGYSLREIAEEVGVSAATVCRILNTRHQRPTETQQIV
jgi:DNA invertase Pin-like site-specific DNA recombinase